MMTPLLAQAAVVSAVPEAFKLVAQGSVGVALIIVVYLFLRDRRATDGKLEAMQNKFLDALDKLEGRGQEDRRLYQDQVGKIADRLIDQSHQTVVAVVELKNAVRSMETTLATVQGRIDGLTPRPEG